MKSRTNESFNDLFKFCFSEALLNTVLEKQLVSARKFMNDFACMNALKSAAG